MNESSGDLWLWDFVLNILYYKILHALTFEDKTYFFMFLERPPTLLFLFDIDMDVGVMFCQPFSFHPLFPSYCSPTFLWCWTKAVWKSWCLRAAKTRGAWSGDLIRVHWMTGGNTRCVSRGFLAGCVTGDCVSNRPTTMLSDPWMVLFGLPQVFCCSGGRGGQEGGCTPQRSARAPAPTLPRWYSRRGGADVQQGQRPIPGMYMEPDDQHRVCNSSYIPFKG